MSEREMDKDPMRPAYHPECWLSSNRRSPESDRTPTTNALWKEIRKNLAEQARQFVLRNAKTVILEEKTKILERKVEILETDFFSIKSPIDIAREQVCKIRNEALEEAAKIAQRDGHYFLAQKIRNLKT